MATSPPPLRTSGRCWMGLPCRRRLRAFSACRWRPTWLAWLLLWLLAWPLWVLTRRLAGVALKARGIGSCCTSRLLLEALAGPLALPCATDMPFCAGLLMLVHGQSYKGRHVALSEYMQPSQHISMWTPPCPAKEMPQRPCMGRGGVGEQKGGGVGARVVGFRLRQ